MMTAEHESEFSRLEGLALARAVQARLELPPHWLHGASLPCGAPDLDTPTALLVLCHLAPDAVVVDDGCEYRAQLGGLMSAGHMTPGRALGEVLVMGATMTAKTEG